MPAVVEYLVLHGEILSPKLLIKIKKHHRAKALKVNVDGVEISAVFDPVLDITVIFDTSSHLPYIIRAQEQHGDSTNDLYLSDYKSVNGLQLPHMIQTVYNSTSQKLDATLEDYIIESITLNPKFPHHFFQGLPEKDSFFPKAAPKKVQGIPHARITEFSSNMLWSGITNVTTKDLRVEQPVPGMPNS
ncbi:hypothetical protein QQX98_010870 [Neonectria punicea]|uniref:Uncharacterized protein n=1 Tax=Neonectria punicea TaxID=979145 RepID=A0ABR1GNE8_9HYPO